MRIIIILNLQAMKAMSGLSSAAGKPDHIFWRKGGKGRRFLVWASLDNTENRRMEEGGVYIASSSHVMQARRYGSISSSKSWAPRTTLSFTSHEINKFIVYTADRRTR